jgi:hypothetical protein
VDGEVDVPSDARRSLAFDQGGCSSGEADRVVESDRDEHWSAGIEVDSGTGLGHWAPDGGWRTGTSYTVTFDELDRSGTGTWAVSVELEFVGFGSGLSRVRIRHAADPGEPVVEVTAVETGTASVAVGWPGDERDALCLFFVQEGEAGRGGARSEDVCTSEIEVVSGCRALGAAGVEVWWLSLVPLWRRRSS